MDVLHKTAIIILTYNNVAFSKDCIESIRKYTDKNTYEIIVVDNNSTDETREWLLDQTDIKLQLNDKNEGFPRGCNIGIRMAAPDDDILLLNNDTIVTPRWLENLQKCLYSSEDIGAAGAVSGHHENLQGVNFTYETMDKMQECADANNVSDSARWEQKVFLIGFCLLIKREVINKIGLLDEAYSPGYVEDNDLSLRIIEAGYRLMLCHDCFIHHYLGSGFRKDLSRFYPVLFANRATFLRKWKFETVRFDEIDHASLRILNEPDKQKEINILQLGCGIGITLLKIKYAYKNAVLFGWDPDVNMAKISSHFATVSTADLNSAMDDFQDGLFDYVLIGHYPELAQNPKQFLQGIHKKLKPGGFVITTIQNVLHFCRVRDLLSGKWFSSGSRYRKTLITDYTLKDFSALLADCGYTDQFTFHWFSVLSEEDRAFIKKLSDIGCDEKDYSFSTYMYSIKARKA